jgi:hypothetical protein
MPNMKKLLLSSLFCTASFSFIASAQSIRATKPGYAYDSFDSATDYIDPSNSGLGIYLSKDTLNTSVKYIYWFKQKRDGILKASKSKTGNGVVSYTVSEPYSLFIPQVGVSFGDGKSIDLSNPGSLKVTIGLKFDLTSLANTISGVAILFRIKDIKGKVIDSKGPNGGLVNQYKDQITLFVDKLGNCSLPYFTENNSIKITTRLTEPGLTYVSIDFNNGGYGNVYADVDTVNQYCSAESWRYTKTPEAFVPITGFDSSHVAGFQMTFLERSQLASDCYFNFALTDLKFDLTEFQIGSDNGGVITAANQDKVANNHTFLAYPNPIISGNLKLSEIAENVKVYDALGIEVFSSNTASEINIDEFRKGLYTIKSSKGFARFVVE